MKNSKIILWGFLQALGVAVYASVVVTIMRNGDKIFGEMNNFLGPVAFLLLFVLSAAITASLTLGRAVLMYLDNRKTEAVKLFGFTLGWLFLMVLMTILSQIFL